MYRSEGNHAHGPYTEGEKSNPADDLLMADTGAVVFGGNYEVTVTLGASAAAHFALQRRNIANDGSVGGVPILYGPAGATVQYTFVYRLESGQRLRVIMDDALTGTASVSLNMEQFS